MSGRWIENGGCVIWWEDFDMPSKTPKQHRAMAAAAHGNSTLGIPQKVGKEFIKADKGKKFKAPKPSRKGKK